MKIGILTHYDVNNQGAQLQMYALYKKNEVQEWYDGYKIGEKDKICNTWSTLNFLQKREIMPYWVNTSSNDLVKMIIKKSSTVKERLIKLLQGEEIEVYIDEYTIMDEIEENEENVWGMLVGSGYLRITEEVDKQQKIYKVKIPNKEISLLFQEIIQKWFFNKVSGESLTTILQDLINLNFTEFEWKFKRLILEMFSFFDVGENEAENFYHAFVLGLLVALKDNYYIYSNRESGLGRYDISIQPKDVNENAFILEFKTCKNENDMKKVVEEAKQQIEAKKYDTNLKEKGYNNIVKIAFGFYGKNVEMEVF